MFVVSCDFGWTLKEPNEKTNSRQAHTYSTSSTEPQLLLSHLEELCRTRPAVSVLSAILPRDAVPRLVVQRVIGRLMPHSSIDAGVPHLVLNGHTPSAAGTIPRLLHRYGGPPLEPSEKSSDPTSHSSVSDAAATKRCGTSDGLSSLHLTGPWPADVELAQYARNLTSIHLCIDTSPPTTAFPRSFFGGVRHVKRLSLDLFSLPDAPARKALISLMEQCDTFAVSTRGFDIFISFFTKTTGYTYKQEKEMIDSMELFKAQLQRPPKAQGEIRGMDGVADFSHLTSFEWRAEPNWKPSHMGAFSMSAVLLSNHLGGPALRRLYLKSTLTHRIPWVMIRHVLERSPNLEELTLALFELGAVDRDNIMAGLLSPAPGNTIVTSVLSLRRLSLLHMPLSGNGAVGFSDAQVARLLLPSRPRPRPSKSKPPLHDDESSAPVLWDVIHSEMSDDTITSNVLSFFHQRRAEAEKLEAEEPSTEEPSTEEPSTEEPSTEEPGMSMTDFETVPLPALTSLDLSGHHALSYRTLAIAKARAAMTPLMVPFLQSPAENSDINCSTRQRRKGPRIGLRTVKILKVWPPRSKEALRHAATTSIDVSITV